MAYHIPALERLIERLERLPGIGHKSASRLAFYLLDADESVTQALLDAVTQARRALHECAVCHNLTERELCPICAETARDRALICVVEDPRDAMAIERAREYTGLYHVLHGVISPMDGVGPEQLRVKELLHRAADEGVGEVILATNPTVEGEATAMYLARLLKPFGVRVTRLAYGIPVGGELEYADEVTLRHSLEGRTEV